MIFLDTSGLFCLHDADEHRHDQAFDLFAAAGPKLTHGEILSEFVTLCRARSLPRGPTITLVRTLLEHPDVEIVWIDEPLHRDALDFLEERPDKGYSFCDAISFLLMSSRGITEALTTDRHFEQAGFVKLLQA